MPLDYAKLGLKVGLEWHQRLKTHKLFCNCPSKLKREEGKVKLERKLYLSESELGEIDPAAEFEKIRNRTFIYHVFRDVNCEVEADESPPLDLNKEALEIALTISLMLNMQPVDEIHVMRKIVIDGSNTSGFQRTALVALGTNKSIVQTTSGSVKLETLTLEEESAFIVKTTPSLAEYKLDRLGMPLIEVATASDIKTPEQAREVAEKIGMIFRSTRKVQRGLGTIRQDINVSIKGGARQEIKGVQKLELIPLILKNEVKRQLTLIKIKNELKKRMVREKDIKNNVYDVTEVFRETHSRVLKKQVEKGGVILAAMLPGFKGLLKQEIQTNKTFGYELATYAKVFGDVKGIFHTDELPGYGVTEEELKKIKKILPCKEKDAVVIVAGKREKAEKALKAVIKRVKMALNGVPSESRRPLEDGTTEFMRPLPGPSRMYPETDIPPIQINEGLIKKAKRKLPPQPEEIIGQLVKKHNLTYETAKELFIEDKDKVFEEIVEETKVDPKLVASTLLNTLKSLKRNGVDVKKIGKKELIDIFKAIREGMAAKEAIPNIIAFLAQHSDLTLNKALEKLDLVPISMEEAREIIDSIIKDNIHVLKRKREKAVKIVMGEAMKKLRGKMDGKEVYELVREAVESKLIGD